MSAEVGLEQLGNINGMMPAAVRELHRQEIDAASRKNILRRSEHAGRQLEALKAHIEADKAK